MSLGLDETSTSAERPLGTGDPLAPSSAPSPVVSAASAEPAAPSPFAELGLTYDDVLLQPGETDVIPSDVDTTARLTRGISIRVPLISAAMDTVTEARMAIAMARHGGIGILHRNLSIHDQAYQVDLVKRTQTGMISNPVTIGPDATLEDLDERCGRYRVSGLPVVDEREHLPIIDEEGRLRGLITVKDFVKSEQFPQASKDGDGRLLVGAAVGYFGEAWERATTLVEAGVDGLGVGTPHRPPPPPPPVGGRVQKEPGARPG